MPSKTADFSSFSRLMSSIFSNATVVERASSLLSQQLNKLQTIELPLAKKQYEEAEKYAARLSALKSRRDTAKHSTSREIKRLKLTPDKFDKEFPDVAMEELDASQWKYIEARQHLRSIEKQITELQFYVHRNSSSTRTEDSENQHRVNPSIAKKSV